MADQDTLDYLGARQPLASRRLQSLPGASGGGGTTAPATPLGAGAPGAPTGGTPQTVTPGGGTSPGAWQFALRALGLGKDAARLATALRNPDSAPDRGDLAILGAGEAPVFTDPRFPGLTFPTHPDPNAGLDLAGSLPPGWTIIETPSGPQITLPAAAGLEGADLAAQGSEAAAGAGGAASGAGQALPFAGAALNIGLEAAAGQKPAHQQAVDAAFDVAGAAFAVPTFGLSMLGSQLAKQDLNRVLPAIERGDWDKVLMNAIPLVSPIQDIGEWFGADVFGLEGGGEPSIPASVRSTQEGMKGAEGFLGALRTAGTPAALVSAMNQGWAPYAGQFRIDATTTAGEHISNLGQGWGARQFTEADLRDPGVLKTLTVQAGELGNPADQGDLARALKMRLASLATPAATATGPPPPLAGPAAPMGPSGALGFARDLIDQGGPA